MTEGTRGVECRECRNPMNRHARMVRDACCDADEARIDPVLDGVVSMVYTCPRCGDTTWQPRDAQIGAELRNNG